MTCHMTHFSSILCLQLHNNNNNTTAVSVMLESAEIMEFEGENLVNVTVTKGGNTTVEARVILNTIQNGTAVGKPLVIFFL